MIARPRRRLTARTVIAVVAVGSALTVSSGCATEVLQAPTSSAVELATTTLAPSLEGAPLDELTAVLREETLALSEALFASDTVMARTHLSRINEAWSFAEPQIAAKFGEFADQLIYDLQRVIELARSAVERNRPADASKATKFLELALQSLAVAG
ncbi:MAG: hypothetical protein ACO3EM_00510 [Ilumatobacteraceae bacterium]|nr:hypothetical protein [Actinomycetota bacterium]NCV96580.1 hypothetical protein [Acidimicrobiia bacterium]NCZ87123.1 hypothetical protein [Actinomycetota bacterium]